jgi:hypothetical protein
MACAFSSERGRATMSSLSLLVGRPTKEYNRSF